MKSKFDNIKFGHRVPLQTRFNDVDMFGHLNNTVYLQFFDQGKYEYLHRLMPDPRNAATAPVVAHIDVDFLAPSFIDEKLAVETTVTAIGESSLVLTQRIVNEHGDVKCEAQTVMVNIDVATGRPVDINDEWREALTNG